MILPFSSRRSRTFWISNFFRECSKPRAKFSKSMNTAMEDSLPLCEEGCVIQISEKEAAGIMPKLPRGIKHRGREAYLTQSHGSLPPQWSQEQAFLVPGQVQCVANFLVSALNFFRQASAQK